MKKSDDGSIVVDSNDIMSLILNGNPIPRQFHADKYLCDEMDRFPKFKNTYSLQIDPPSQNTIEQTDAINQANWKIPEPFKTITDSQLLSVIMELDIYKNEQSIARIKMEFQKYSSMDLLNVLRFLLYFSSKCRKNNVVIGIGRGSSVASYILYLIGISKVDPIRYDLDFSEFLL